MLTKQVVEDAIAKRGWQEEHEKRKTDACSTCWGHGIWAIGDPVPMGPMDARGGMPKQACPECGAGG